MGPQATPLGRATTECAVKVVRAETGKVEGLLPYSAVFRLGLAGAIADVRKDSACPEEWDEAEITVDMSHAGQCSCPCGLVWMHPHSEPLVCPRCRSPLEAVEEP